MIQNQQCHQDHNLIIAQWKKINFYSDYQIDEIEYVDEFEVPTMVNAFIDTYEDQKY